jgi:NAD(P)-dependent dehydrogenase (short-subunit alcohol dehydrogenase family)
VIVGKTMSEFGRLDILVNNAAEQHMVTDIADLKPEQIERTFRTNIFRWDLGRAWWMCKPHLAVLTTYVSRQHVLLEPGKQMPSYPPLLQGGADLLFTGRS